MPGIGRVTSFQFRSGSCPKVAGSFDFQVLRPVGDDRYQVVGNTGTRKANPRDVSKHCAWLAHFAPKVQQQDLVRHDHGRLLT